MPGLVNAPLAASATSVTDGGATETVVLTIAGIICDDPQYQLSIDGMMEITTGASGTVAVVIKCRRGTTTSAVQVGPTLTAKATTSTEYLLPFCFVDTPGAVHDQSYVITVTETSASADGSVGYVVAQAIISSFT